MIWSSLAIVARGVWRLIGFETSPTGGTSLWQDVRDARQRERARLSTVTEIERERAEAAARDALRDRSERTTQQDRRDWP